MNITKQKETHRYRELVVTSGERVGRRVKSAVGDLEAQTTMYEINKLQGYIVQHREYSRYFIITLSGIQL